MEYQQRQSPMPHFSEPELRISFDNCLSPELSLSERLDRLNALEAQLPDTDSGPSIVKLRRFRNSLLPVARVPNELLCDVIMWSLVTDWFEAHLAEPTPGRMDWIAVSCVCHHWRTVALSTPKLWSHINIARLSHPQTQEFLERSISVPLTLYSDGKLTSSERNVAKETQAELSAFLSDCFPRIRRIAQIYPSVRQMEEILSQLLTSEAPLLEDIHITAPEILILSSGSPMLRLLDSKPSALRQLRFENIPASWDSLIFRGLTHLNVNHSWPAPMEVVLEALTQCPRLIQLSLALLKLDPPVAEGEGSSLLIHLDDLKGLHLSFPHRCMTSMLSRLRMPNLAGATLSAVYDDDSPLDLAELLPTQFFNTIPFDKILTLYLHTIYFGGVALMLLPDIEDSDLWIFSLIPPGGREDIYAGARAIFSTIGSLLPLPSLTYLEIGSVDHRKMHISADEWTEVLARVPTVISITLRLARPLPLIQALHLVTEHEEEEIICPLLFRLVLRYVEEPLPSMDIWLCFTRRALRRRPLYRLDIEATESTVNSIDVETLRLCIDEVDVRESDREQDALNRLWWPGRSRGNQCIIA